MATITFTVAQAKYLRVVEAFSGIYQRPIQVPDPAWVDPHNGTLAPLVPNPETKVQFFERKTKEFWRDVARSYEIQLAIDAARIAADNIGDV